MINPTAMGALELTGVSYTLGDPWGMGSPAVTDLAGLGMPVYYVDGTQPTKGLGKYELSGGEWITVSAPWWVSPLYLDAPSNVNAGEPFAITVDNIAEGSQAKRRGDVEMISHMTPPIVVAGLYGNFTNLAQTAYNYNQVLNATVKENYKDEIIAGCEADHLDEDLEVNLTELSSDPEAFDEFVDELEH